MGSIEGGVMRSALIHSAKHHLAMLPAVLGLFLLIVLVFTTTVFAGPGGKSNQRYVIFDAPNAGYTAATNINDAGTVTGYFFDAGGQIHGFVREQSGRIIVIDAIPNARDTEAVGTNVRGET